MSAGPQVSTIVIVHCMYFMYPCLHRRMQACRQNHPWCAYEPRAHCHSRLDVWGPLASFWSIMSIWHFWIYFQRLRLSQVPSMSQCLHWSPSILHGMNLKSCGDMFWVAFRLEGYRNDQSRCNVNVVARYCKYEQVPTCADQDVASHPFLEAPIRNHSLGH